VAEHHIVETRDSGSGTGVVLGILFGVLVVAIALFFVFGGAGRFTGNSGTPNQTNVNVPAQSQPQTGPTVNVPRQDDVNETQQPAQQAPAQPSGNR